MRENHFSELHSGTEIWTLAHDRNLRITLAGFPTANE